MTGAYTIGAVCAPAAVVAFELTTLRTGILRRGRFWVTIAITLAFQVPVDGWLTKLSAPIVLYRPAAISGARWPWDIPVEDFGFAFAMITLTLALWERVRSVSKPKRRVGIWSDQRGACDERGGKTPAAGAPEASGETLP